MKSRLFAGAASRSVPRQVALAAIFMAVAAGILPAQESPPASPPAAPAPTTASTPDIAPRDVAAQDALAKAFFGIRLDTTRAYRVSNLPFRRDAVTLLLKQGTLFLTQPIDGQITGAAFVGDGQISWTPPNQTERFMLRQQTQSDTLAEPFTEAAFRFTDGSGSLLIQGATPDPDGATRAEAASAMFADRNGWLDGTRKLGTSSLAPEMNWLEARASGYKNLGTFLADLHTARHDWVTYLNDPQRTHENVLYSTETMGAKGRRYVVTWAEWHAQEQYSAEGYYQRNPEKDGPRLFRVVDSDITMNLTNTKVVNYEAKLTIECAVDGLKALRFDLVNNLDVAGRWYEDAFFPVRISAVTGPDNRALGFLHRKDQLLVFLPQAMTVGSRVVLSVKGTAEVVIQLTAESFGLLQAPWYPQYGYLGGRSPFHWTVRVPKPYLITGSGRAIRRFEDDATRQNGLETSSTVPVTLPWVIFGRFQMAETRYEPGGDRPAVGLTLHSFPTMTTTITDPDALKLLGYNAPVTETLNAPQKKIEGFLAEVKEAMKLYESMYGNYPYEELHIAQMAPQLEFGQSPPSFMQLSGLAFLSQARVESDFVHGFLAHELAHQWWGNQIGWASEDDEWLSESFAEYASGIFVKEYQGPKRFQRTLEEWKKVAKLADPMAPIAAANTLSGPAGPGYRTELLYSKGPYVVHMLRVALDDEKYVKVMKSLQENYRYRNISTEMLIREVNRVTQSDYTYFFDQWYYGTGIPVFRYTWRSDRQPDGKYMVTVHVSQDDKKNVKKVLMPVHLHFKSTTVPQYRPVAAGEADIKFVSPENPKDVTLDDDHTLLADFVKQQ